jgi:hypothetical protein
MAKGQILVSNSAKGEWQTIKVTEFRGRRTVRDRMELIHLPQSTVVLKTSGKRYGLPADAKERRM